MVEYAYNLNIILKYQNLYKKQMKYMASEVVSSEGSMSKSGNIDWNDFNYPCLLKIVHFNPDETPEIHKKRVLFLRINYILIIFINLINLIANIAGAV